MKRPHAIVFSILGFAFIGLLFSSCTSTGGGTHRMGPGKAHQTGMPDAYMPNR